MRPLGGRPQGLGWIDGRARSAEPPAAADEPRAFRRLLPDGEPATAAEIVEELGLPERAAAPLGRPYVLLNMVSTVDGRATSADGRVRSEAAPTEGCSTSFAPRSTA